MSVPSTEPSQRHLAAAAAFSSRPISTGQTLPQSAGGSVPLAQTGGGLPGEGWFGGSFLSNSLISVPPVRQIT